MTEDPRLAAARYRVEQLGRDPSAGDEAPDDASDGAAATHSPTDDAASAHAGGAASAPRRTPTAADRAAYVETAIQQAIRRGEFDDLPGAGKPIPHLGERHDPDWWIRRKIETERLSGLGPPALMLRVEHAELDARLDALRRESDVRETLEDFNRRVIEARRQLLGGPPVVTPTRDVDAEVRAWRERREARARAVPADEQEPPRPWWRKTR